MTDTHFRQALVIAAIEHELGNLNGSAVGVGPVRAAAGAAHLFCVHRPPLAVLIGTAGAYLESIVPPAVIAARRVGFADQAVAHNTGYVPLPPETIVLDTTMTDRLGVPSHDVLTVSAITTDPGITATYAKHWQIEHMEAWAVAWAAQQAGVPLVILLGVANQVGPNAHAEWLANREAAEAAAREVALRLLAQVE